MCLHFSKYLWNNTYFTNKLYEFKIPSPFIHLWHLMNFLYLFLDILTSFIFLRFKSFSQDCLGLFVNRTLDHIHKELIKVRWLVLSLFSPSSQPVLNIYKILIKIWMWEYKYVFFFHSKIIWNHKMILLHLIFIICIFYSSSFLFFSSRLIALSFTRRESPKFYRIYIFYYFSRETQFWWESKNLCRVICSLSIIYFDLKKKM